MKFTKEEAREKLMGILTNNGKKPLRMSEESVDSQLETLLPIIADEEMELKDFVEKVQKSFETMNSNAESDNSKFVKQWKKDHPEKKDVDVKDDVKGDSKDNDIKDEYTKKLEERLEKLEQAAMEADKKRVISSKKSELMAALEGKGVKDKEWINAMLNVVNITEDMDIETSAKSYLDIYNKQKSESDDFTPLSSSSRQKDKGSFLEDVKNLRKSMGYDMSKDV